MDSVGEWGEREKLIHPLAGIKGELKVRFKRIILYFLFSVIRQMKGTLTCIEVPFVYSDKNIKKR